MIGGGGKERKSSSREATLMANQIVEHRNHLKSGSMGNSLCDRSTKWNCKESILNLANQNKDALQING